jgi:pimeloyl-ACP methyl ester carboxylesterase
MSRMRLLTLLLLISATAAQAQSVVTTPITFRVRNPLEPLFTKTVRGTLYAPSTTPQCAQTAVLLMHGLSYGAWVWDFPFDSPRYSVARALARRGFVAVSIDELGYGSSDRPNGWNLTVESYGAITAQLVSQLKSRFSKVVLYGHSAGSEMSELAAGAHGAGDGLIASAYSHFPSAGILLDVITSDTPRALLSPYIYFGADPSHRAAYMYEAAAADPAVMTLDTQLANLTPSGEILTIGSQPSRASLPLIHVPVLLLQAERDQLFPPTPLEAALFLGAADRTTTVVPGDGHSFMLHLNAQASQQVVLDWLSPRYPSCPSLP